MLGEREVGELDVLRIGPHASDCRWDGVDEQSEGKGSGNVGYRMTLGVEETRQTDSPSGPSPACLSSAGPSFLRVM